MDYCWEIVEEDDFLSLNHKIPKKDVFKYLLKYLNNLLSIEKAILLLKSKFSLTKSQFSIESSCIKVEGIYLYSFLTRKFLNFASERSLTVMSNDNEFPFTIRNSILKVKLSKEEFEYLGLVAKRGSFKGITPNAEKRYKSLLGPERTRPRNVIITSKEALSIEELYILIGHSNAKLQGIKIDICSIGSKPLYFFQNLNKEAEIEESDGNKKREREDYIPVEANNKNINIITKYKKELISYFKHENLFKKVYFTIKHNLTTKNFEPSQIVQDLENPRIENLWLSELDSMPLHGKLVEDFLIQIGRTLSQESTKSGDSNMCVTSKISIEEMIPCDEIIKLIQFSYKESKEVNEEVAFVLVLFSYNPFEADSLGDVLYLVCQRVNGHIYFILIRTKP